MNGKDEIKDLFGEKLSAFEADVRPELWVNVSSQISTIQTGSGPSFLAKLIIGISVAASVGVLGYLVANGTESTKNKTLKNPENVLLTNSQKDNNTAPKSQVSESVKRLSGQEESAIIETEDQESLRTKNESVAGNSEVVTVDDVELITIKDDQEGINSQEDIPVPAETVNEPKKEEVLNIEPVQEQNTETGAIGELFNIFTPNGDGANDKLYVESKNVTDFSVVVIDQQNRIIYQSSDPGFEWDGTAMNGDKVPAGKYVYYVTARNSAGKVLSKHSVLQISR